MDIKNSNLFTIRTDHAIKLNFKVFTRVTVDEKIMDRPPEIKMNKVWSLCVDCWCFDARKRPSFSEIREQLEKILDKTPRRLPRSEAPEYSTLTTSEASDSADTGYTDDTTSNTSDTTSITSEVYYGYFRCDTRIGHNKRQALYDNEIYADPYIDIYG